MRGNFDLTWTSAGQYVALHAIVVQAANNPLPSFRYISPSEIRPFRFGKIKLTENEEDSCREEEVIKNLGTIQVKIYRIAETKPGVVAFNDQADDVKFYEGTNKAQLSHNVK